MRKGRCFNEGDWMNEIPKVIIRSIKKKKVQEGNNSFIPELQSATPRPTMFLTQHQYIETP